MPPAKPDQIWLAPPAARHWCAGRRGVLAGAAAFVVLVAGVSFAAPSLSPRVHMVHRGDLAARVISDGSADERAVLLVRASTSAAALRQAGLEVRELGVDLFEVRGAREAIDTLVRLPGVRGIEERRLLWPQLDAAGPVVRANEARVETGLTGQGVLVAVVDTGIDFRHADLRNADGTSRVAALIDMAQQPDNRHPSLGPAPGRLFLKSDIDAVLAAEQAGTQPPMVISERDTNGHGTHVAAIIASGGLATGRGLPAGRFVGIAPGAEVVAVQASRGGNTFTDSDVLAACRYVVELASRLGCPLVLNLSLGGAGGPHDGTATLEMELDTLFPADAAGRAVVIAAGNDGARDYHAALWQLDGEVILPLNVPASGATSGVVNVEIWYRGAVTLSVVSPSGAQVAIAAPGESTPGVQSRDGRAVIDNASGGPRSDGRSGVSLVLEGPMAAPPAAGVWKIHVTGQASRFDGFIIESPPGAAARFTDHVSVDDLLALPATAHNPIVVGAFVSKPTWVTVDGQTVMRKLVTGAISNFSASGPTFDGRFAPDVIAPGEFVGAAISADAPSSNPGSAFFVAGNPTLTVLDDGLHGALRGTSQAAPLVAGTLALLLQHDRMLTGGMLREILRASAHADGAAFSPRAGFGKLDVLAALRLARGMRGGAVSPTLSGVGASRDAVPPGGEPVLVTVTPRDSSGTPLGPGHAVEISASAGSPSGPVSDTGAGRYQRAFVLDAPRGAQVRIDARVDGVPLDGHPTIWVVRDRSEIGSPFVARGGCQAGPLGGGIGALLLVSLGLLLAKIRARRRPAVRSSK